MLCASHMYDKSVPYIVVKILYSCRYYSVFLLLWQLLDQCPMKAQSINLTGGISSGNISCVFTRELDREPQQYSTNYLYKYPWSVL